MSRLPADSLYVVALALTLPSQNPSARTRAWRALKAVGAAVLRDGVYVLPSSAAHEQSLLRIGQEVETAGGTSEILLLKPRDNAQEARFRRLFDRSGEYAEIALDADALANDHTLEASQTERRFRSLQRHFEQITLVDFFPGEVQAQTARALTHCQMVLAGKISRGEPHFIDSPTPRLSASDYQGRIWATRARPWVDRMASAWLIRRHIDPNAAFVWFKEPAECPPEALGFDFDGADFTHVGHRVTFETLMASFGLEGDPALRRIAAIVHQLDVGGAPVPEAAGVSAVLAGTRASFEDDNELLEASSNVFDWLYKDYQDTHES